MTSIGRLLTIESVEFVTPVSRRFPFMIFKYSRDWPHCVQRCVGPLARDNKIFSAQFVPSLQFYRIIKRINDTPRTVFCLEILLLRQRFQKYLSAKFSSVESLFSLIWRIKRKSKFLRVTKTQESLFRKRRKLNEDIDWSSRNNIHGSHVSR